MYIGFREKLCESLWLELKSDRSVLSQLFAAFGSCCLLILSRVDVHLKKIVVRANLVLRTRFLRALFD